MLNDDAGAKMRTAIAEAKTNKDSVGCLSAMRSLLGSRSYFQSLHRAAHRRFFPRTDRKAHGEYIGAHILSVHNITDAPFDPVTVDKKTLQDTTEKEFPVLNDDAGAKKKHHYFLSRTK